MCCFIFTAVISAEQTWKGTKIRPSGQHGLHLPLGVCHNKTVHLPWGRTLYAAKAQTPISFQTHAPDLHPLSPALHLPSWGCKLPSSAFAVGQWLPREGCGPGWNQGGKSRSAKQTLAKTDHLLAKLLIPLGCWRSAEGSQTTPSAPSSQLCAPGRGVKTHWDSTPVFVL